MNVSDKPLENLKFERRVRYEKRIDTIEELDNFIKRAASDGSLVYRGMKRDSYLCVSSFYRYYCAVYTPPVESVVYNVSENAEEVLPKIDNADYIRKSFEIIDEFNSQLVRVGEIEEHLSFSDACTLAQHYELPTNLIDFTVDPIIAIFFACAGDDDHDAVIFESDIWLPINQLNAELQDGVRGWYKDPERAHANVIRRLTSIDKTTEMTLATPIICKSMLERNERIKLQSGVFVYYSGAFPYDKIMYNFWDEPYSCHGRTVYVINKSLKSHIRAAMKDVGLSWEKIMPASDGIKIKEAVKATKAKMGIPEHY